MLAQEATQQLREVGGPPACDGVPSRGSTEALALHSSIQTGQMASVGHLGRGRGRGALTTCPISTIPLSQARSSLSSCREQDHRLLLPPGISLPCCLQVDNCTPPGTHVVEGSAVPSFLEPVQGRVEEAQGRQPSLEAPVIDQGNDAPHHGSGGLRWGEVGRSPGAGALPSPAKREPRLWEKASRKGCIRTEVPETQGMGMRLVTTQ